MMVCEYTGQEGVAVMGPRCNVTVHSGNKSPLCYGVEIELEGFQEELRGNKYWRATADGSLRNGGMELVSTPFTMNAGDDMGAALNDILQHHKRSHASYRCGLHVHANALSFNEDQLRSLFMLYIAAEPLIWNLTGERQNSEFCIPLHGSQRYGLFSGVLFDKRYQGQNFYDRLHRNAEKYQAMNYAPLFRFGTVEFRHHKGEKDWGAIFPWVQLIDNMMCKAKHTAPAEMFDILADINRVSTYMEFAKILLTGTGYVIDAERGQDLVRSGVRNLKVLRAMAKANA